MAERIETPIITIPAGTLSTAPQITALSLRDAILEHIEVVIPPGPSGLVGFALRHSGQQVIPFTAGQFVIGDGEKLAWDVQNFPTGDKWSVAAYNTDVYNHSLYFRILLRELPTSAVQVTAPVQVVAVGTSMVES